MLVAEIMSTPSMGDDTVVMFLPGAIIQSYASYSAGSDSTEQ